MVLERIAKFGAASIFATLCLTASALADVVLTVKTDADTHEYSIDDLRSLGERTVETSTIWTEGLQVFTGVSLDVLLQDAGIGDGVLTATAINDYAVEIPVEDATTDGPIVAFARNGEPMSIRDKGPLWVIYPYDSSSDFQSETVYSRSIWQLDRISVQ